MASKIGNLPASKSELNPKHHLKEKTRKNLKQASEVFERAKNSLSSTQLASVDASLNQNWAESPVSEASAKVDAVAQASPSLETLSIELEAQHNAYEEKLNKSLKNHIVKEEIDDLLNTIPERLRLWPDTRRKLRESCYLAAWYHKDIEKFSILFPLFVRINGKHDNPKDMLINIFTWLVNRVTDNTLKSQGFEFLSKDDIYPYISDQKELLTKCDASLPIGDPLKLKLFQHQAAWDREVWEQWINAPKLHDDQKLALWKDDRARCFIDKDKILSYIQDRKISANFVLQLILHLKIPYHHDICLTLIKKLKQANYPISVCQNFLAYLVMQERTWKIPPEMISPLKTMLQGMQKRTQFALKDTDTLVGLIERLPDAEKSPFVAFYFNLLPFSFEKDLYTTDQRKAMYSVAETYACLCPFSVYLGLKDNATIQHLDLAIKKGYFSGDKFAAKFLAAKFGELASSYPNSWPSNAVAFGDLYLDEKKSKLTFEELIKTIQPFDNPQKKGVYVCYVLQNNIKSQMSTSLKFIEELIAEDQVAIVKCILSSSRLESWAQSKETSKALGNFVEAFVLKLIDNNMHSIDAFVRYIENDWIVNQLALNGHRIANPTNVINRLAQCIPSEIVEGSMLKSYYDLISSFISKCSELYLKSDKRVRYVKFPLEVIDGLLNKYGSRKDINERYFHLLQLMIVTMKDSKGIIDRVSEMEAVVNAYNKILALQTFEDCAGNGLVLNVSNPIKIMVGYIRSCPDLMTAYGDSLLSTTLKWLSYTSQDKITIEHMVGFSLDMCEFMTLSTVQKYLLLFTGHIERYATAGAANFKGQNLKDNDRQNIHILVMNLIACSRVNPSQAKLCMPKVEDICKLLGPFFNQKENFEVTQQLNLLRFQLEHILKLL